MATNKRSKASSHMGGNGSEYNGKSGVFIKNSDERLRKMGYVKKNGRLVKISK